MKIQDAITRLEKIQAKHGDVEIYFDCPDCKVAFTPDFATTVPSVVLTSTKRPVPDPRQEERNG